MQIYENSNYLNQSRLKKILQHPKSYLNDSWDGDRLPSEALRIGNAVDCLLTEPEKFEEKFLLESTDFKVTGMFKTFLEKLFISEHRLTDPEEAISEEDWFTLAFQESTPEKTRFKIENFIEDFRAGQPYYEYLIRTRDKIILSFEEMARVEAIIESLKSHTFTRSYFEDYECVNQLEIYWQFQGIDLKSKLDRICISHEEKTIYPIDFKTTETVGKFHPQVFYQRRYDFQGAVYTLALKDWAATHYPGYEIKPFRFVVESSKYPKTPLVFELSEETYQIGLSGGTNTYGTFEGFYQAIDRYKWHTTMDLWDYRREEYLSNGLVVI